jgi:Tol biopolymer transport system component
MLVRQTTVTKLSQPLLFGALIVLSGASTRHEDQQIYFTSFRDGVAQVYSVDVDNGTERRVTSGTVPDQDPDVSPDGQWIVFESGRAGIREATTQPARAFGPGTDSAFKSELYLMRPDGSELHRLTKSHGRQMVPKWSPDGKQIAISSTRDFEWNIYVMNADGEEAKRLTFGKGAFETVGSWSSDASRIVFTSNRDALKEGLAFNYEVYVMDADGKNPQRLTNRIGFDGMPSLSPDGNKIVFVSDRSGRQDLWVMDADGGNPTQLGETPGPVQQPAWSPDGQWIAFSAFKDNNWDIYMIDADGTRLRRLTTHSAADGAPSWGR